MSDFDREAEREKLREKYERDKEKREASERMSELLLQGATMTNRHCPDCHSPVFRYEGRQFCPTCEKEVTEAEAADADEADADEQQPEPEASQSDAASASGSEREASAAAEPTATDTSNVPEDTADRERSVPERENDHRPADDAPTPAGERRPARVQPPARQEGESPEKRTEKRARDDRRGRAETGEELRDAGASLQREIGSLTRQAEETRDVGRKRDLLAAAREAAETLEAIRRL